MLACDETLSTCRRTYKKFYRLTVDTHIQAVIKV